MSGKLIPVIVLLLSCGLAAQAPARKAAPNALERATRLREEDPAAAIRALSDLIQQQPSTRELTEAFLLLGDIYADIGQRDLALGRYARALELAAETDSATAARLYRRRGELLLTQGDFPAARVDFGQCLTLAPAGSAQNIACKEGLADVEAGTNNLSRSQDYYQQVQESRPADSLLQLRVNTKRADVYLQQNDLERSANSLNTAITQLPQSQPLPAEESAQLIATNARLRDAVIKNAPTLDREIDEVRPGAPAPLLATDKLARFRSLRDLGRDREAAAELDAALAQVTDTTPPKLATRLYTEGADFYLSQRQPERAAAVYRAYTAANERLYAQKLEEIELQAAILREQQAVDLGLKDLAAAETESVFLGEQVRLQRWLIYLLGALLLGALLSVGLILRTVRKRRRANRELRLRNLQTRMNPHFIFNSLNSINNYIARQDERAANRYLGRFAKLMRNVLDQSGKDFVSLGEELEQLALYLELEQERFAGKFTSTIVVPPEVEPDSLELPPMILQPFVENAIWHGLRYRPDGGTLTVEVLPEGAGVRIEDNGIGRARSEELKTTNQRQHRSTGVATSRQRLALINAHYGTDWSLKITDLAPGDAFPGTRVELLR